MIVRPGRVLPSVIVGALVTGSLALGMGTASADPINLGDLGSNQCVDPDTNQVKTLVAGLLERTATGLCQVVDRVAPSPVATDGGGSSSTGGGTGSGSNGGSTTGSSGSAAESSSATPTPTPTPVAGSGGLTGGVGGANVIVQPAPAGAVPAPVAVSVPAPSAFSSAPGGLAARFPALGFGSSLNPALLGVPLNSPLHTLVAQNGGSPVTTTSDVQAMAFDNVPGGLGTPAVVGVLILSALGAFALRHRVLRRARVAAAPDTVETPVRPAA